MNDHNKNDRAKRTSPLPGVSAADFSSEKARLDRAIRYIESKDYEQALRTIGDTGRAPQIRNVVGVCLMRLGRVDDAIGVYRDLVLQRGGTWMISSLPLIYKTNFATALLMGGHPSGCLDMLMDVHDQKHPSVIRLCKAIKQWESRLPLWPWLNWRFGRIEPANRPVELDFAPGDFADPLISTEGLKPTAAGGPSRFAA